MTSDKQLDLEFAYSTQPHMGGVCNNLYSIVQWCKRPAGHDGEHASGFGANRRRWTDNYDRIPS